MRNTTKAGRKASSDDPLAQLALDMIRRGESRRSLLGYTIDLSMVVTPILAEEGSK